MAKRKRLANEAFLGCARVYLPTDASVRRLDPDGKPGESIRFDLVGENSFCLGDAEAAGALCCAVQDLAMEEATGRLLALFPTFQKFSPHREVYAQLALTLDRVEVLSTGRTPRALRRVRFRRAPRNALGDGRLVLYQGRNLQALSVSHPAPSGPAAAESLQLLFYSFNPALIRRFRLNLEEILAGEASHLHEFTRLLAIDQAAREINQELFRQKQAMDLALRRLQLDSDQYGASRFASDLQKELSRLSEWKIRLPKMLAQATRPRP